MSFGWPVDNLLFNYKHFREFLENFFITQNIVYKSWKCSNVIFSMECFTADFLQFCNITSFSIWVAGWVLALSFESFQGVLEISWNPKSSVIQQFTRQLIHSPFGDNNLVPFPLWWTKIVLNYEKVYKYFCVSLICHVASQDHLIKRSSNFMSSSS